MTNDPVIIIDTREQSPLKIERFQTIRAGLPVGDYGVLGFSSWDNPRFIVERKSVADLVASLTVGRVRFVKEIEKMRQFGFRALVIEGTVDDVEAGLYRSQASPQSVIQSLISLKVRCNLHVEFCGSPEGAARAVEDLARHFVRGVEKDYKRLIKAGKDAAECATV